MDLRVQVALQLLAGSNDNAALSRAAETTNLSKSRLRHLIKAEIGIPPGRYLKRLRLDRAAKLLGSTFLRVKEIVHEVGFSDTSHFVHDFKSSFGVTPTDYRRALHERRRTDPANSANA
ncbi:MAG: helix-turn-helix transcriptional regulator [Acidobacteria bacterium]|nr:helix-turn-helix transcriptional regulator [Acidobacteriota bacterium]